MTNEHPEPTAAVWRRADGWVFRVLPGRVMLARTGGKHRTVAGSAAVAWTALDVPATTSEVWERIVDVFHDVGIEPEDVGEAIDVLVECGVVERAS